MLVYMPVGAFADQVPEESPAADGFDDAMVEPEVNIENNDFTDETEEQEGSTEPEDINDENLNESDTRDLNGCSPEGGKALEDNGFTTEGHYELNFFSKSGITGLYPPLISDDSSEIGVDYEVNEGLAWRYSIACSEEGYAAYIAGNSYTKVANVSNIAFTVTGPGVFSFDYMVSTTSSGDDYALYYNINTPIDDDNYKTALNHGNYLAFRGLVYWTKVEFNVMVDDLDENGQATIYLAYYRGGTNVTNQNVVAVANVCYLSGQKTLVLNIDGEDYGYVTDGLNNSYCNGQNPITYHIGDTVELTAVPGEGCRFYGWSDGDNRFLSTNADYSFMISSDTILKAVFAPNGYYTAQRNGVFYADADNGLAQALAETVSGDIIIMLEDQTLTADAAIPAGAKLYIPFSAEYVTSGNANGDNAYPASVKIAGDDKTYRTLTINSSATLSVNGTLNIGGVIGHKSQGYQGHTSGSHGKIINEGTILIENGGILDCWGFIIGNGIVTAASGSAVYEPFIVYDFAGGWNTAQLYLKNQSPFKQYALQNIQSTLVLDSGSKLYGRCNLWADSNYNKVNIVFIGDRGMYQPADGATITRVYDGQKYINTNADIGRATYVFNGGMRLASLSMPIMGFAISTKDVEFPIPYNWEIVLEDGDYCIEGKVKLMPGAVLTVENDARLDVDGTLFVLDGLIQSDISGKRYPATGTLQADGFSASGQLFINGELIVGSGAIFGGIVQTETGEQDAATVTIKPDAVINSVDVQDGAVAGYDVNTSLFDLPARAYVYNIIDEGYTLQNLFPGRVYSAYDNVEWEIDSYAMVYAVNCSEAEADEDIPVVDGKYHQWAAATVALNEDRSGSWTTDHLCFDVNLLNNTIYDASDSSKVTVEGDYTPGQIPAGGNIAFTVANTEVGKGYVFQVAYVSGDDSQVILSADQEGIYTIDNVQKDVFITVTSCRLGDVNLDGKINLSDLLQLSKIIAGYVTPTPMHRLAANTNSDVEGRVNLSDLLQLSKYIAGYINVF